MGMVSDEQRFEVLYDHYKDSFTQIASYTGRRERAFFYLVVLMATFQISTPANSTQAVDGLLTKLFGAGLSLSPTVIDSVLWLLMLVLSIRYFRLVLTVNLQYDLLHEQEARLCQIAGPGTFTRERAGYISGADRTGFRALTYWLYTAIFPLLMVVLSVIEYVNQVRASEGITFGVILNGFLATLVCIATLLYVRSVHFLSRASAAPTLDKSREPSEVAAFRLPYFSLTRADSGDLGRTRAEEK